MNESLSGRPKDEINSSSDIPLLVDQMDGYSEIGMRREAIRIARRLLRLRPMDAGIFIRTVAVVLTVHESLRQWRGIIEDAHSALREADKRGVRESMLGFYYSVGDFEAAARFIPIRYVIPANRMFVVLALLELKRLEEARKQAAACEDRLGRVKDVFEKSCLLQALASFHTQAGNHEKAEALWREGTADPIFARSAWEGLVELGVVKVLRIVNEGLAHVEKLKGLPDEQAIELPGNRDAMIANTEKMLLKHRSVLEKIVPRMELWRYGVE